MIHVRSRDSRAHFRIAALGSNVPDIAARGSVVKEVLAEEDAAETAEADAAKANAEWQAQVEEHTRQQEAEERQQQQQQATDQARQQAQNLTQVEHELLARQKLYTDAAVRECGTEVLQIAALAQTDFAAAQAAAAELARRDPQAAQKYARFQQLDQAYRAEEAQAQLISTQRQHQQRQAFQQWAASFTKSHPEIFSDRRVHFETLQNVREYVTEKLGLTEDRVRQLWTSDPSFRSAEGQALIYDAAKAYAAEKNLKAARRPEPTPAFQRPGTGNLRVVSGGNADAERLRAISAQPTLRKQIAEAAKGLAEKRRVAKQGRK